ncbi:MAG: sulfatase-like hydrolase/transferase [Planctomycetaceae bacterium]|nr:sulfatase-like hydrolase/transferase [Planctomycetaceae bacterium]
MRYFGLLTILFTLWNAPLKADERPNILWITSEDNGPHLGCYGDEYADTPNIDSIAEQGVIYQHAWSTAPVCAPARTTIITGMYPPSLGAQHMRSSTRIPDQFKLYPEYLRQAGYYCTNNSKQDYNLPGGNVWDESSNKAHWRNRKEGQPFFAIFNFTTSHESRIRRRPHTPVHDPAKVRVPAYHPDTPEVRRDWAQYYDKLTEMDQQVGKTLKQLKEDGLADDTIIFYYGDHGSGMPRSKRWPYSSGLRVPMIVSFPEKYRHLAADDYQQGGSSDRLVGFVDLAPTVLSLAGIEPPEHMQGHAFHGKYEADPQPFMFGFRGRMDERYDMVRVASNGRFIYLRQFMPHRIYGEHVDYMFQTPTTQVWYQMYQDGKLNAAQSHFWEPKPAEELYDLQNDPDEVNNLADSPQHQEVLKQLRSALHEHLLSDRDAGFLPEPMMHARAGDDTVWEMTHDPQRYNLQRIMQVAYLASNRDPEEIKKLAVWINDDDAAVRYWSILGLNVRGESAIKQLQAHLQSHLDDESPSVRIVAAEALAKFGDPSLQERAIGQLIDLSNVETHGPYVSTLALNSLDAVNPVFLKDYVDQIKALPTKHPSLQQRLRMSAVTPNLIDYLMVKINAMDK